MSEQDPNETRGRIVVPGRGPERVDIDEGLVSPADIESTSRSCLVIIVILIAIAVMVCVFLAVQPFID